MATREGAGSGAAGRPAADPAGRAEAAGTGRDFLRAIISQDQRTGKHGGRVVTRFPPEPNGFLHIGHAKSICLNFGLAAEYGGVCHLRFDDTNPETEDIRYVESIQQDVRWLGFDWGEHLYFASDYFERMYEFGEELIRKGSAYVDSLSDEEIRDYRGSISEPGRASPYRDRPADENLDLFRRMRAGEFPDGAHVLRARIDMASKNMLMRDPVLYRIRHASHYRTGDAWCIYPLYDYAHPLEDALERITHSICTLEFDNNRELYDWVVENTSVPYRPYQYEFARLNLEYTVMSKRKLLELVRAAHVSGWDDPRMPTIAGLRRRGVTPESIRTFCDMIGVSKVDSRVDIGKLEYAVRDDLNRKVPRVLCVVRPLRVVLTNYPAGPGEAFDAPYYPHDVPLEGTRKLPFGRELYVDRDDFMEDPPPDYFRLSPGAEVRLRYAYIIRCDEVVKDADGRVVELRCSYDPASRGGAAADGRKVKGTIHWVSGQHSLPCQLRLYDRLFSVPDPDAAASETDGDFKAFLNPDSLVVVDDARVEPAVANTEPGVRFQFERVGYFFADPEDSRPGALVFNRTVTLRDSWAKVVRAAASERPSPASTRAAPTEAGGDPPVQRRPAGGAAAGDPAQRRVPGRSAELAERLERFVEEHGLAGEDAELLTRTRVSADLFEATVAAGASAEMAANWIIHELPRESRGRPLEDLAVGGDQLGGLLILLERRAISTIAARTVLAELVDHGGEPATIVERRGLGQAADPDAIRPVVEEVLAQNEDKVALYRSGRTGLLGFFVGQVLARTGARADPELVRQLLERKLDGET